MAMRPNNATVTWKSQNVSGDVTVVLKKGGNPVRSQTVPNTGSCSFSYMGVAEGADYRIRVEGADHGAADESDGNFSIKKEVFMRVEPKPGQAVAPRIISFRINNGAEQTNSRTVTLNNVATGSPTHYRVEKRRTRTLYWTEWFPYSTEPTTEFSGNFGEISLRLQVKNDVGESEPVADSIQYVNPELEYGPGALRVCPCPGGPSGWKWSAIETSFPQNLSGLGATLTCDDNHAGCYWAIVIRAEEAEHYLVKYGAKYEFEFFAGRQLNEGWEFVRLEYEGQEGEGKGYRITRMPQPGSRDITFRVRVWVDAGYGSCTFKIRKIVVKGPAGRPVQEAFQ